LSRSFKLVLAAVALAASAILLYTAASPGVFFAGSALVLIASWIPAAAGGSLLLVYQLAR
jgi:hypothetical protein